MSTRHEIPVENAESVVAVHHEPSADADSDAAVEGAWIVCCHGFLSDKTGTYEGRCRRAAAEGYHGVRFDFRGCGESDGAFVDQTLSDKIADLRAVIEHFEPDRLVLFGSSFGGKVAFHAAPALQDGDDPDLLAIAARAPVTYNRTFAETRAAVEREGSVTVGTDRAVDERFFADLEGHPFEAVAGRLDCPVLVVHGAEDDSVPVADSFEAAAALSTDVLLEKVSGEGHRFSRAAEGRLRTRLFDWLAGLEAA